MMIFALFFGIAMEPAVNHLHMKRGMRRSADALKQPTYVEDKTSGELRRPHHVDLKTGMYRGRQILSPKGE